MEEMISRLAAVRDALGTLNITSTRHNLDCILGSIQIIDKVIERLQTMEASSEKTNDQTGE